MGGRDIDSQAEGGECHAPVQNGDGFHDLDKEFIRERHEWYLWLNHALGCDSDQPLDRHNYGFTSCFHRTEYDSFSPYFLWFFKECAHNLRRESQV